METIVILIIVIILVGVIINSSIKNGKYEVIVADEKKVNDVLEKQRDVKRPPDVRAANSWLRKFRK